MSWNQIGCWDWVRLIRIPPDIETGWSQEVKDIFHYCLGRTMLVSGIEDGFLHLEVGPEADGRFGGGFMHSIYVEPDDVELIAAKPEDIDDASAEDAYGLRREPEALRPYYDEAVREHGANSPEALAELQDIREAQDRYSQVQRCDPKRWRPLPA